jgi:hypothetical protein
MYVVHKPHVCCADMLRRYFERTGCHLAKTVGPLDNQVALEQLTREERQAYVQDLRIPYSADDEKVRAPLDYRATAQRSYTVAVTCT